QAFFGDPEPLAGDSYNGLHPGLLCNIDVPQSHRFLTGFYEAATLARRPHEIQWRHMLWLKAFHIIFVVTWFAGLFYLPRLFVYHAVATDQVSLERFVIMERRLFGIMTFGALLAIVFGLSMLAAAPGYLHMGWLHAKLTLVAALIAYHIWCRQLMIGLRQGRNAHSQRWYRMFNEVPMLLLIGIVILAVVKPF